jgi:alpha-L-rhamnosidase
VRGTVSTEWELKDGRLHLEVIVPANTRAKVQLPDRSEEVGSGTHVFEVPFK